MAKEQLKEGLIAEFYPKQKAEEILVAPESTDRSPAKNVKFSRPKSEVNLNLREVQAVYTNNKPDRRTSAFKSQS